MESKGNCQRIGDELEEVPDEEQGPPGGVRKAWAEVVKDGVQQFGRLQKPEEQGALDEQLGFVRVVVKASRPAAVVGGVGI